VAGSVTLPESETRARGTVVVGGDVVGVVVGGDVVGVVVGDVVKAVWPLAVHSECHSAVHVIFTLIAVEVVPTSLTCILAKVGYVWRFSDVRSRVPSEPKF
jgi:hypothetical protein